MAEAHTIEAKAPTDLTRASAAELAQLYRAKAASPVEVMQAVLARAEQVNPKLNALTIVEADAALAAAKASEARWAAGAPLSPLDGAPLTVKELVRVAGWPHSMGSLLADKTPVTEDAPSVARLREAGAIVWSQNTSPEYGHKGVTDSPLHGVTRNPWNLERTPGGSSGGTGAAVAAGLGPLGIGTDGGGSVRIPAAFCGLVGLKATYGRVAAWPPSMHGDLANVGPMTRTVADCALMLNEMAKPDTRESFPAPHDPRDWTQSLAAGVKGLKVGLLSPVGRAYVEPPIADRLAAAAKTLGELGAIVEPIEPPAESAEAGRVWVTHWFSAMQRLLQIYPAERHNEFDPSLFEQARTGHGYTVQTLVDAMVERRAITTAWNQVFTKVDLVIMPTLNVLPFPVAQGQPLGPDGKPNLAW
ncbi:MAG TPA: amidase family protein, partial [Caulobacteraceae bacterium]|nr:amidase family protein [Caulobacteraceae bacterium]